MSSASLPNLVEKEKGKLLPIFHATSELEMHQSEQAREGKCNHKYILHPLPLLTCHSRRDISGMVSY